jgi:ribosomal-protein-alanine N-acetyltransferase
MPPTLTTPRLVLRPFTMTDVEPLYTILKEPDILKYFPRPDPPELDRVGRIVAAQIRHWQEHNLGWWAVCPSGNGSTGALAGWCGLQFLPETGEVEVGYLLSHACWGQGFATEAARASLAYGFDSLNLESIICLVDPDNLRSNRVAAKLEMNFLGKQTYFGMLLNKYVRWRANDGWATNVSWPKLPVRGDGG